MKFRRIMVCVAIALGISTLSANAQPTVTGVSLTNLSTKQMKELAAEQTDMMKAELGLNEVQYNKLLKINFNRLKVLRNTGASGAGFGGPMGGPGGFRPGMGGRGGFPGGGFGPGMGNFQAQNAPTAEEIEELTKEQRQYEAKVQKVLTLEQLRKFQANRSMGSIRRQRPEGEEGDETPGPGMGPGGFPGGRPGMGGPGGFPGGGRPGGFPGGGRP